MQVLELCSEPTTEKTSGPPMEERVLESLCHTLCCSSKFWERGPVGLGAVPWSGINSSARACLGMSVNRSPSEDRKTALGQCWEPKGL